MSSFYGGSIVTIDEQQIINMYLPVLEQENDILFIKNYSQKTTSSLNNNAGILSLNNKTN